MRIALTVLCGAALLVAGCGSEEHPAAPADTLVRASAATKRLGGHHVEMKVHMRFDGVLRDRTFDITGGGDIDPLRHRAEHTVDLSDLAAPGSEAGDTPAEAQFRGIERGTVIYVQAGSLAKLFREVGVDATWLALDYGKRVTSRTKELREAIGNSQENPGQLLDYLDAARGHVERLGEEVVGGERTTRYRGTTHLDRIGAGQPARYRVGLRANARRVKEFTGREALPIEVWVDDRGAVRRVRMTYELVRNPDNGRPIDGSMRVVADLSGFGRQVRAEPPPKDEVISLEELVRLAE